MRYSSLTGKLQEICKPVLAVLQHANHELALKDASSIKSLALIRWELMRHLRAYQLYKHTMIFDPIIRSSPVQNAKFAQELKTRCLSLAHDYEEHVSKWSLTDPATGWLIYVQEARAIYERIERHLFQEAQQIVVLLSMNKDVDRRPKQSVPD